MGKGFYWKFPFILKISNLVYRHLSLNLSLYFGMGYHVRNLA